MLRTRQRKRLSLAALLLVLLLGLLALLWPRAHSAPLAHAIALRDQLTSPNAPRSSPIQRQGQFQELRRAIDHLSPEERREFWTERRRYFRDWLDEFFRASPREQAAILNSERQRMKEFRDRETAKGANARGPGWTNGLSEEELRRRQKIWLDLTTAEERALVDAYYEMLVRLPQPGGQSGFSSPWGNAPT